MSENLVIFIFRFEIFLRHLGSKHCVRFKRAKMAWKCVKRPFLKNLYLKVFDMFMPFNKGASRNLLIWDGMTQKQKYTSIILDDFKDSLSSRRTSSLKMKKNYNFGNGTTGKAKSPVSAKTKFDWLAIKCIKRLSFTKTACLLGSELLLDCRGSNTFLTQ